tara:strand:- start:13448 stop:13858 length:411 start_codon:yes stop_codon:yes gene_type:complete
MSRPHALKAPPLYLYLVQRQDFSPHSSDDIGRLYIHSIHTTKAAANKKARVLIRVIRRDEDYIDRAVLETEKLEETGHYYGYLKLHQDESDVEAIHHVEVTVVERTVDDEHASAYSDSEDENDFADEVENEEVHFG